MESMVCFHYKNGRICVDIFLDNLWFGRHINCIIPQDSFIEEMVQANACTVKSLARTKEWNNHRNLRISISGIKGWNFWMFKVLYIQSCFLFVAQHSNRFQHSTNMSSINHQGTNQHINNIIAGNLPPRNDLLQPLVDWDIYKCFTYKRLTEHNIQS